MLQELIEELLKNENKFVSVEFRNKHLHTVKAYNKIQGSPYNGIFEGQLNYINFVCKNERTELFDIHTAATFKEAVDNDIIMEDGNIF